MTDESCSSTPDDPRRFSRCIAGPYSSVRLSRGIAGCKSRRTGSLPGRLPVSKPSRRTNSEPRASLAFPARVMDEDFEILRILYNCKISAVHETAARTSSWYPDDDVQRRILSLVQSRVPGMDAIKLKQRIDAFECMVRKHLVNAVEIRVNKELLLQVFSNVTPESSDTIVLETQEARTITIPSNTRRGQKRASNGSDIEHHSKRCSYSAQEILNSDINMKECARKLERCGFSDEPLWHAIDLLKADLELRQVFIGLGDHQAKGYILHVLDNSHV